MNALRTLIRYCDKDDSTTFDMLADSLHAASNLRHLHLQIYGHSPFLLRTTVYRLREERLERVPLRRYLLEKRKISEL